MLIRPFQDSDAGAVWKILEPTIREGATYTLPPDMSRADALAYWCAPGHQVYVAEEEGGGGEICGTYLLRKNQQGGGAHVANCGYMTAREAAGRGVARAMCAHSLQIARAQGFLAMQFNFVISSNTRALALWQAMGFTIVGTLPQAFRHPQLGLVDVFVMHRPL